MSTKLYQLSRQGHGVLLTTTTAITLLLLLVTLPLTSGQATFRRACSCERSSQDGKCRFLLEAEVDTPPPSWTETSGGSGTSGGGAWLAAGLATLRGRLHEVAQRTSTLERVALKWVVSGYNSTEQQVPGEDPGEDPGRHQSADASEQGANNEDEQNKEVEEEEEEKKKQQDAILALKSRVTTLERRQHSLETRLTRLEEMPKPCR